MPSASKRSMSTAGNLRLHLQQFNLQLSHSSSSEIQVKYKCKLKRIFLIADQLGTHCLPSEHPVQKQLQLVNARLVNAWLVHTELVNVEDTNPQLINTQLMNGCNANQHWTLKAASWPSFGGVYKLRGDSLFLSHVHDYGSIIWRVTDAQVPIQ